MDYIYKTNDGEHRYKYPMVSATASVVIIDYESQSYVLVGKRSANVDAFPNHWAIFGGFLDAGQETVEQCAVRELNEELGIDIKLDQLDLIEVRSNPKTDPRAHVVNVVYMLMLQKDVIDITMNNEHSDLKWVHYDEIEDLDWAFDHKDIVCNIFEV